MYIPESLQEENLNNKCLMGFIFWTNWGPDHTPEYGDGFRTLSVFRTQSTDGISTEYGRNLKYLVRKQYGDGIIWKFGYGYGYGYGLKKKMGVRVRNFDWK